MEQSQPLISIITVVYNSVGLLEKTIKSIFGQDYPNIEYIIIDGGSVDGSLDIISKYQSQISHWISEKDNGIYHAMNKGIEKASGEWICFLNSGDTFVDQSSVSKTVEAINSHSGVPDVIYGNILIQEKDGSTKEKKAKEPCNIHRMHFCHQSSFTKSEVLHKNLFDEKHLMSADFKFFKECYYNQCKFFHLDLPLVIYDTTGISNFQREKGLLDNIAVIKEVDTGWRKYLFILKLYFVIYWRRLTGKNK